MKSVCLYNWTEPLLHPRLAEFIKSVKRRNLFCAVSSNLNLLRNIDDVLAAGPDEFRISLSGFTQEVYGVTHARGDIEKVKENMKLLSEAKRRSGSRHTRIHVFYHKYRNNLHEIAPMREYAKSLGFDWFDNWAYYMPVEKALDLIDGRLPALERKFVEEQFAVPIVQAIEASSRHTNDRCTLLEDQITLNVHGVVGLCCGVYDWNQYGLGRFLDLSRDELTAAKQSHSMCGRCFESGVQAYTNAYGNADLLKEVDALAAENLAQPVSGGMSTT